ncbi:derepression protein [Salmonella enterica subsp. enterica serovar Muenchen]|uniref:Derepression protein n=1 Tax=Salmonella enterica subsp. enterica serovar Ank TaxID=1173578 RepID=A0A5I2WW93_SALET|nr:derepression protein [Salmonella enterica subsp. enterica serovar Muenchen]EBV7249321.1 derepression protein [Salmonella enterica subsp. enterica serovar Pomona]ECF3882196.1 derepression protein [Salmonella enterica subsp. enterica serovar Ank]EEJ1799860.1 derepression protein [Salmonella enterica subsp. enterica serovar Pomona]HAE1795986.1 derepression protein [Salmonella enterica subsp. enterica serovar Ank]
MANRRHTRADVQHTHTQTEINRRLYRAKKLARCLWAESLSDNSVIADMCISSLLSYLADDLRDVHKLFNEKKDPQ